MIVLYLMCGIPGSGKSTWIKQNKIESDAVISRDVVRFSLVKEHEEYFSKETEVFYTFIDQINELRDWAGKEVKTQLVQKWMDKMWNDGVSAMADISNDDSSFDVKKSHKMYTRTYLEVFGSEPEMCEGVMKEVTDLNAVADAVKAIIPDEMLDARLKKFAIKL